MSLALCRRFSGRDAWRVAVAVVVIACVASVTALAASSYSVRVAASSPVVNGHSFSVTAHGVAKQRALLYVYVDHKGCLATTDKEASREEVHKSGESYFVQHDGGRTVKKPFAYAWVSGSFKKAFRAHAGTASGREYACAYLDAANRYGGFRVTAAHTSASYTVTK